MLSFVWPWVVLMSMSDALPHVAGIFLIVYRSPGILEHGGALLRGVWPLGEPVPAAVLTVWSLGSLVWARGLQEESAPGL